MPPKIIKLGKKDDIANVVRQIRATRDSEIIFELEKGSALLKDSDSMRLMKRTGEAMGKKILVETDDETGKILAKKAGVLAGDQNVSMPKQAGVKVSRSDVKPRFSDIGRSRKPVSRPTPMPALKKTIPTPAPRLTEAKKSVASIPSRFGRKYFWGLAGLVLVFFTLAVLLPQATVTVLARSEPVSRDLEIIVDKNAKEVNSSTLVIPGIPVTKEVSLTKNFQTSGTSATGAKASGSVFLYNFTPFTLTLRASTTTLISNNKKYFFTKDVTGIRATSRSGTVVNESTTTGPVAIIAELPGDSYNLGPNTKFTIQNAALGNQEVYAINKTALTGGGTTDGKKTLSEQDLVSARTALTDEILKEAETDLSEEAGQPVRVLNTGVQKTVLADTANKEVGSEADNFDMTLIAKVIGLGFYENDVTDLVATKINEVLSSDKYLVDDADSEYNASFKNLDLAIGRGTLSVHFETVAAYKVDSGGLKKILAGKTGAEIREIMLSKPEVDSVKVDFWPSWMVHKAPRFNGRIEIKTILSE